VKGTWQTTGSSGRGGGVVVAVIAAAWLIGSGALSAIVHALAVVIIILGRTVALAVLGGVAVLILRTRQDHAGAPIAGRVVSPAPRPQATPLAASQPVPPVIEHHYHGPSIHIHGDGQDAAAAVIRKALTEGNQQ
jgi:hypothetical protein